MTRRWLLAACLAAAALAVTFDPKLYINGDNVEYIFQARAIRGGDLWPSDKYPPLFPMVLAPVQAVSGLALLPQKLVVLAFAAGAVLLLARILRRRLDARSGPWVLWVAATLIPFIEYSHYVMSEVPYLFFLLGAIDACDRLGGRVEETKGSGGAAHGRAPRARDQAPGLLRALRDRRIWILAAWVAAAFYTRTAGLALAAGVLLWLLLARRPREGIAFTVALLPFAVPWLLHSAMAAGGNPYVRQLLLVNPYYPEFGFLTPETLVRRLRENAHFYLIREVPATIFPAFYGSTYSPPAEKWFPWWIGAPLLAPFVAGLWRGLRRADPVAPIVLLALLVSCLWPLIWAGSRFLVPIVPLLLLLFWQGWRAPEEAGWGGAWPWIRRGVLVLLVVFGVRNLVFYTIETRAYAPEWDRYFTALRWIAANTQEDAVIIDRKPGFVEYVAGRRASGFPREADPERMREALRRSGATHVVLSSLPYDDIGRFLHPTVRASRDWFEIVFQVSEPPTYVLRFHPSGDARSAPPVAGGAAAGTQAPVPVRED